MISKETTRGRGRICIRFHDCLAGRVGKVKRHYRLLAITTILVAWAFSAAGCGQPSIAVRDEVVHDRPAATYVPADYVLGHGDQLEVLYQIDPGRSVGEYVIDTEDRLRVDFFYYPMMSRSVRVRPDGYITLPRVGEVKAAGLKPTDLAKIISEKFRPFLTRPSVTVEVVGFNAKLEELKRAITTQDRGQSRLVVIRPDGKISLPYLDDIQAAGLTPRQLSEKLEKGYQKIVSAISITVAVLQARSNRVYVMGQVRRPNFYQLLGPTTLSQIIAQAGGFTEQANTHQVVVISRRPDGRPEAQVVDMDRVIGQGNIAADRMLKQYDVVFVPYTKLGEAALTADALWRLIPLRFTGTFAYTLGGTQPD